MSGAAKNTALQPVLLVGAGRSGTNLVARTLGASSDLENVYEQRYIWTKGIRSWACDLRAPEEAEGAVGDYIRRHFARQAAAAGPGVRLVDKTPSNALRLDFCLRVFPEAKVINVIRNPLDNIASRIVELNKIGQEIESGDGTADGRGAVLRRRISHFRDLILRGNIPFDRLPAVFADQLAENLRIAFTGQGRRYAERVPGLPQIAASQGPIAALCHQWRETVMAAVRDGRRLGDDSYLELRYEDLVQAPADTGRRLTDFVGLDTPVPVIKALVAEARPETVGRWRDRLTAEQRTEIINRLVCEMAFFDHCEGPK